MNTRMDARYAELAAMTGFSFLEGASHAEEMVAAALAAGVAALGIADRNTLAGVVRGHEAARQAGLRFLPGARLVLTDAPDVLCYPTDRAAWGRLCRMLTIGKGRTRKGDCQLALADLLTHAEGQALIALPGRDIDPAALAATLPRLREAAAGRAWLGAARWLGAEDDERVQALDSLATVAGTPLLAVNAPLFHVPERRALQDVLACIRLGTTIEAAGRALAPNAERHLKGPAAMARLFARHPRALEQTMAVVDQCRFSLAELAYEYPDEPVPPGRTPDEHLADLAWKGAAWRYPAGVPPRVTASIRKELGLIADLGYAPYFLTVHDIVAHARGLGILCQGRGSAANSAVCYCLGVTAVDPAQSDLLFERFVSAERREPPDIDVDFEHERREEVIQYIYQRYGRHRAGIAATVIHYRPKMAIREVGRVMGLSPDQTAGLSTQSRHSDGDYWPDERVRELGLDPSDRRLALTLDLARALVGMPRHLSQHVGGFILTKGRLDETVPIGPAAMAGRSFIEWDKDDIDALGIMKVDVLALGMLTCIRKAFALLAARGIPVNDLAAVPREDPVTYDMLCRGDSVGVFQVESRAQMNMLPRLRPREFYDLVIEVAIVRPGPIQGDMVHPYLRRRQGIEPVSFPSPDPAHGPPDELERVLGRTMGVPLFQEQAMKIAIVAAGFTPGEANALRRAMATFRNVGTIHTFRDKMVGGMVARGYTQDFAERCFRQIEGFGTYGFPESHAASFAQLVYVSAWLKAHHPAAFAAALLNSQPMGFYAPAQIVRDAREHGVEVRGPDVNRSGWECAIEPGGVLRLGFNMIGGFREDWAARLAGRRFNRFADLAVAGLPRPALEGLARADAMRSLGLDRRQAQWQVRALADHAPLPLLDPRPVEEAPAALPAMAMGEQVAADYRTTGLSLKAHPLGFLRDGLAREGVLTCAEAGLAMAGRLLRTAGIVLVRQRPGSASGVIFATIEDETGIANVVIWPAVAERFRRDMLAAALLEVEGRVQRSPEGIVHLVAERLVDRSGLLAALDGTRVPRSRDFR